MPEVVITGPVILNTVWGGAVKPVAPVPPMGHANEYPPSGQQQPSPQHAPVEGEVAAEDAPAETTGTIYTPKGEIVNITPGKPTLDVTG